MKAIRSLGTLGILAGKWCGGLGMRHLDNFNQVMLAKLGWYIIHNPSNLGLALLKDKYFFLAAFLEAPKGKRPLYLWSSIL